MKVIVTRILIVDKVFYVAAIIAKGKLDFSGTQRMIAAIVQVELSTIFSKRTDYDCKSINIGGFFIHLIDLYNNSFAVLVHTEKGTTCSDSGFHDLSTDHECFDAVGYAKSFNGHAGYITSWSFPLHHKGCFIWDDELGTMYFNRHPTGNNNAHLRSICRKGNY